MKHKRTDLSAAVTAQRVRARGRGTLVLLVSLAVLGAATATLLAGSHPANAAGPTTSTSPTCLASNPPDELTLAGGTPQSAKLDSPFATPFQVVLANSNGCPVTTAVAGTTVTFSAPANGSSTASGTFAATGSSSAVVGTDANGSAQAPAFTANDISGSYTVTANSSYGSVTFALTNTAAGLAATLTAQPPASQTAVTGATYSKPLQALVLDANGNPVEGAAVMFTLGAGGGGGQGGTAAAAASFAGGQNEAGEQTNASGVATSPPFTAGSTPGKFTATAATAGVTNPVSFQLDNIAGKPPTLRLLGATHGAAVIGAAYSKPLQVEVLDAAGKPVQGASVTFTLGSSAAGGGGAGGAGSATPGASFVGGSSQATETTGARGRASSPSFIANSTPGTFTATVSVTGRTNPLLVTLENLAGTPPELRPVGAARGSATVNTHYRRPLEVKVVDAHGKPIQGTTVTFSLGAGSSGGAGAAGASGSAGASFLDGASQATEATDAAGIAVSPAFTANGTAGVFAATASVPGVRNPAMFELDNLAAKPPAIRPVGAVRFSATVDTGYRRPLEVKVVNAGGKPVQGTTVTFSLGAGSSGGAGAGGGSGSAGASFLGGASQASETTDAAGIATSPVFSANGTTGAFTATASVTGVTNPAMFELDNRAAELSAIEPSGVDPRSATVGGRYEKPLQVRVVAADGKPVEGSAVTFTLGAASAGGGASGATGSAGATFVGGSSAATATTNAAGRAVSPSFAANTVAGSFTATASISGTTAVASFPLRNLAGVPATITPGAAASEQTTVGTRFPIRLAVTVKDKDGNLVDGSIVTFTAPAAGATGRFAAARRVSTRTVRVRTDSDGIAVAPPFAASQTTGGYVVTATVTGAGAAAFALVNQPSGL